QERLVSYICHSLVKEAKKELEFLNRDIRDLERIEVPFSHLTYDEAIEILQRDGFNIQWGATFDWVHEKHLSLHFSKPFFISEFPVNIENFFFECNPEKPEYSLTVDLFAPEGYGEISSGGQPTFRIEETLRKIKEEKVDLSIQKWYIDLKSVGSIPYSGFSIGIERLTRWICRLIHIKETVAFPRLISNIYP
ncbi:MAG: amino acid--tRNA ligase-related protein, partial [Candidatus Helarchaeota archaeon]